MIDLRPISPGFYMKSRISALRDPFFIETIASYGTKMHFTPLSVESEIFLGYSRNKDIYRF